MDALLLLENDHRTVEALFREFRETRDPTRREGVAAEIREQLSVHAAIEEMELYPVVRKELPGGDAEADEALQEHQEVKELLASMSGASADDPELLAKMAKLEASVAHHVKDEETKMFPELRQKLGSERLAQLGERLQKAKATAPTHPHPNAPNRPPMNKVAGAAAAAADKVRDAVSERKP